MYYYAGGATLPRTGLTVGSNGAVLCETYKDGSNYHRALSTAGDISSGTATHLAGTLAGKDNVAIYKDGVALAVTQNSAGTTTDGTAFNYLRVGRLSEEAALSTRFHQGPVYEAHILKYAAPASEMKRMYLNRHPLGGLS
jgi:hypothetical protein